MSLLSRIFTWWNGATIGTRLHIRRNGEKVATDAFGNSYYTSKKNGRRWVTYAGETDPARLPPEWYGWLHGMLDSVPDTLPPPRPWQKAGKANPTGTAEAFKPAGSLDRGGQRPHATGDYEAWTPE